MKRTSFRRLIAFTLTLALCLGMAGVGALATGGTTVNLIPSGTPEALRPTGDVREIGVRVGGNITAGDTLNGESSISPSEAGITVTIDGYMATITASADVYVSYIAVKAADGYTKYAVPGGILREGTTYIAYTYWNKPGNSWHDISHIVLFGSGELVVPEVTTGSLQVTKTVSGLGDASLPSDFQITVTGPDTNEVLILADAAQNGLVYTWTLDNLAPGNYTVTEANAAVAGYTLTAAGDKGTTAVVAGENIVAAIINTYTKINTDPTTGSLQVTKTVAGLQNNDSLPGDFQITVTGPDINEVLTLADAAQNGSVYTWTLDNLAPGSYTVTEANAAVAGYTLTAVGDKGTAAVVAGGNIVAAITNTYTKTNTDPTTGSLTLTKAFHGTDNTVPEGFAAAFQLQRLDGDAWVDIGESVPYSAFTDGAYTFTGLTPGQYKVVEQTPSNAGTGNALSEAAAADNQLYWNGAIYSDEGAGVAVVAAGTAAITVTNAYEVKIPEEVVPGGAGTAQLRIRKSFTGDRTTVPNGFRAEFRLQQRIEGVWKTLEGKTAIYSGGEDNDFVEGSYLFTELAGGVYRIQEVITNHGDGIAPSLANANRGQIYWYGVTYSDGQNGLEIVEPPETPAEDQSDLPQMPAVVQVITVANDYATRPTGGGGGGGGGGSTTTPPVTEETIEEPATPLNPYEPTEPETEPEEVVIVPEEEVPLAALPIEEEPVALAALDQAPKTGDASDLGLWMLLASGSLFGLAGTLILRRKQYLTEESK